MTDLQVLSDRSPQPPGYTRIPEFPEARKFPLLRGGGGSGTAGAGPRFPPSRSCRLLSSPFSTGTGISRKKRVYMKLLPLDTAETAVFDLKLSSKSKALPHYMKIG